MAKAEAKTQPTEVSAAEFIATVPDPRRRTEAETLDGMIRRLTGEPPVMWGPSIIGYGSYHYRYDSGREGDMCRIGFSPRKAQLVLYLALSAKGGDRTDAEALLARLGPHSLGKGCLYIKRLDKVDASVLEALITLGWRLMEQRYPA